MALQDVSSTTASQQLRPPRLGGAANLATELGQREAAHTVLGMHVQTHLPSPCELPGPYWSQDLTGSTLRGHVDSNMPKVNCLRKKRARLTQEVHFAEAQLS